MANAALEPAISSAHRRTLPRSAGYAVATYVIALSLFASVVPSPLYGSYMQLWHFTPLTLTFIYATYAFGVLATLLLAGRVSDDVGRRPALLVAVGLLIAATLLFLLARSTAWLFLARGLQGIATGAAISAASAAMLDLHVRRDPVGVGLANGVASTLGIGLGILTSSALVQVGVAPRITPYVVLLTLFVIAFAGVYAMPESVDAKRQFRFTTERPAVPPVVRMPFLLASLAVLSSWSIAGLFFSLGPELGAHLFKSANVVLSGIGIVTLASSAALSQLLFRRAAPRMLATFGSLALAFGTLLVVAATAVDSSALYLAASVVEGAGFGVAFFGGLSALVAAIPHEHRAAVMSAFYLVAYSAISVPAVVAGAVVGHVGLQRTFEIFGIAVAAVAVAVAILAWSTRPTRIAASSGQAPRIGGGR